MTAGTVEGEGWTAVSCLELFSSSDPERAIATRGGNFVRLAQFRRHAAAIARRLPPSGSMINLCEDRYHFLAAYAAALSVGHTVLLPQSRAELVLRELEHMSTGSYRLGDGEVERAWHAVRDGEVINERIPAAQTVMIGFTSGSTGQPRAFPKAWGSVARTAALGSRAMRDTLGVAADAPMWIVATVPPQHMYGMELSILMPLLGGMAVHAGRPLFPADVAQALAELPEPRVLVSTPVHLRAILESSQEFPPTALIISATAPLDRPLAEAVERKLGGPLLEMFGSTETCVIACRRPTMQDRWRLYEGVELTPAPGGTYVHAPWFAEPVLLQDMVELHGSKEFLVRGRNADMIEVAGKRASLTDLTRRVLAIAGVRDAAIFQPDQDAVATIRRVAALVVAPELTAREILDELAASIDPAFLPRPLVMVEALPRNELGKLPRESLLQVLKQFERGCK